MNWLAAALVAAATGDPTPAAQAANDDPLIILRAQPQLIGVALALFGLIPLFLGWSLVRWTSAILTGALTVAVVLVCGHGRLDPALLWAAALAAGVLLGFLGYFLVQAVIGLQLGVLAGLMAWTGLLQALPGQPLLALVAGLLAAALGAVIGWWAAPYLVIAQCVLNGFLLILAGMVAVVKPSDSAVVWLALVVAVVTVIPGLLVQLRAHARERRGE